MRLDTTMFRKTKVMFLFSTLIRRLETLFHEASNTVATHFYHSASKKK